MIKKADRSQRPGSSRTDAIGIDAGATLSKLAVRGADGHTRFRVLPTHAIEQVAREVESVSPARVGLTGGGAARLAGRLERVLGSDTARPDEFAAWQRGAVEMLRRGGHDCDGPFLLVSVGTGTSAMRVDGDDVTRVGGTALGGGTLIGLGVALTGSAGFGEIVELAATGDRRNVDLLVSDIYPAGELSLPGALNAASFAKLAHPGNVRPDPRDLAHAVVCMVGENVGLICAGLAASVGVGRIVYGGSTLLDNPILADVLNATAVLRGLEPIFLESPAFAGALGAMSLAVDRLRPQPLRHP